MNIKTNEKSLLWEISGNSLFKTSYLYGTIHIISANDIEMSDKAKARFEAAEQLALEVNLNDPEVHSALQAGALLPSGLHLKDLVSDDDYGVIDNFFHGTFGLKIDQLGIIKPFFLNIILMGRSVEKATSHEESFVYRANEKQKKVIGLESVESQLQVFDRIPYEKQAEILVNSVRNFGHVKVHYQDLLNQYKNQTVEKTHVRYEESIHDIKEFEEALISERNKKWIPSIEKIAKEKSTFFAVGAGHIGGSKGLVALLQRRGYDLNPVL